MQENPSKGKRCRLTPLQRVHEFPTEQLTVSAGKLFYAACREELGLKRSVVQGHIKSTKHADGKKRLECKEAREKDISVALRKHDQEVHQKGETLPESQRVYRVKVATAFLRAGVPFEKVECFRELLEENAFRLVDKRYLLDLIPFILKEEQARIAGLQAELPSYLAKAADVSPGFDCLEWWGRNCGELPNWSRTASNASKVLLVQPSSAAAERVFSLLSNCFSDRQQNCLEDYVEASLMLQYNKL